MFNDENVSFQLMSMAMDIASGISAPRLAKVRKQQKMAYSVIYLISPCHT